MSENKTASHAVTAPAAPLPNPWKIGLASARANLVPGLALQGLAVMILICYFCIPQTRAFFDRLEIWQKNYGMLFSVASYELFSAAIPLAFCFSIKRLRPPRPWWKVIVFSVVLWGWMAMSVKILYRVQVILFGEGLDILTLLAKIAFDSFGFAVVYGAPLVAIAHYWKDRNYDFKALRVMFADKNWYRRIILPTLVMNWSVWIPALFVLYSLPEPLQPHIAGVVNGFWSLMCIQIAARTEK